MKQLSKNIFSMMALLEAIRSKADYHKMVELERLKADCQLVINQTKINYN